jgi:hypothetical protein
MTGNQSYGVKSMVSAGGQSSTSEFSIVGSQRSMSIFSGKTTKSIHQIEPIETKKDIYVEDVITQKIIYFISLFSTEVKQSLGKLKTQGLLREFKTKDNQKGTEIDEFIISLDQVDKEFIYTILDILDYYELFKLSMMLCNRYKLSDRIGKYIF